MCCRVGRYYKWYPIKGIYTLRQCNKSRSVSSLFISQEPNLLIKDIAMKEKTIKIGLFLIAGMIVSNASAYDISHHARPQPSCLKTEITQVKDATCESGATINDGSCALEVMARCLTRVNRVLVGNGNNGTLSEAEIELDLDDPERPELNVDLKTAYVDCTQNEIAYCIGGNGVYPKPKNDTCKAGETEYYVPGTEDRLVKLQTNIGSTVNPRYIDLDQKLVTFQCRSK
jgi:hypothetical protein